MLKKDDSCSSPSSLRQTHSEHQRSPTRENSLSRQSSKTPVNLTSSSSDHRENNSTSEVTTANNSNANSSSKMSSSSPISLSEKSNHQNENVSSNGINSNNGNGNNNHRDQFAMNGPEKILPSPSTDRKDFEFSKVNGEYNTLDIYLSYHSKSLSFPRCLDNDNNKVSQCQIRYVLMHIHSSKSEKSFFCILNLFKSQPFRYQNLPSSCRARVSISSNHTNIHNIKIQSGNAVCRLQRETNINWIFSSDFGIKFMLEDNLVRFDLDVCVCVCRRKREKSPRV